MKESLKTRSSKHRRQSDARWRASLANCYQTLKAVVPHHMQASKRQPTKALILDETFRHIRLLETIIYALLMEKGYLEKQEELGDWCKEKWEELKQEFIRKERERYHSTTNRRKLRNPLRQQTKPTPRKSGSRVHRRLQQMVDKEHGNNDQSNILQMPWQSPCAASYETPVKVTPQDGSSQASVKTGTATENGLFDMCVPLTPSSQSKLTPNKSNSNNLNNLGEFTPIKLPSPWNSPFSDLQSLLNTPTGQAAKVDSVGDSNDLLSADLIGESSLFCNELIGGSDDDRVPVGCFNRKTKHRKRRKSATATSRNKTKRRQQQQQHPKKSCRRALQLDDQSECHRSLICSSNFDGYLLFYKSVVEKLNYIVSYVCRSVELYL